MGLMLSILVVCVGVIEALSCYEHFQYGVLDCATSVYENARRRSSVFLKYTTRRLKLLTEESVDEEPERELFHPDSERGGRPSETNPNSTRPRNSVKKLEKEDKVRIVKSLLEKPSRPKAVRSISMPELIHTERDIELSNIINNLVVEPIEEVNLEVEDAEVLTKEFDKLFEEYENPPGDFISGCLEPRAGGDLETVEGRKTDRPSVFGEDRRDVGEERESAADVRVTEGLFDSSVASRKRNFLADRSTSVDFDKVKSLYSDLVSSYFAKARNNSSESVLAKPKTEAKPEDTTFKTDMTPVELIDETFEEIFNDVCSDVVDVADVYDEIEKSVLEEEEEEEENAPRKETEELLPNVPNEVLLKAAQQLAELIVKDCLNIRKLLKLTKSTPEEAFVLEASARSKKPSPPDCDNTKESGKSESASRKAKNFPDGIKVDGIELSEDERLAKEQTKTLLGNDSTKAEGKVVEEETEKIILTVSEGMRQFGDEILEEFSRVTEGPFPDEGRRKEDDAIDAARSDLHLKIVGGQKDGPQIVEISSESLPGDSLQKVQLENISAVTASMNQLQNEGQISQEELSGSSGGERNDTKHLGEPAVLDVERNTAEETIIAATEDAVDEEKDENSTVKATINQFPDKLQKDGQEGKVLGQELLGDAAVKVNDRKEPEDHPTDVATVQETGKGEKDTTDLPLDLEKVKIGSETTPVDFEEREKAENSTVTATVDQVNDKPQNDGQRGEILEEEHSGDAAVKVNDRKELEETPTFNATIHETGKDENVTTDLPLEETAFGVFMEEDKHGITTAITDFQGKLLNELQGITILEAEETANDEEKKNTTEEGEANSTAFGDSKEEVLRTKNQLEDPAGANRLEVKEGGCKQEEDGKLQEGTPQDVQSVPAALVDFEDEEKSQEQTNKDEPASDILLGDGFEETPTDCTAVVTSPADEQRGDAEDVGEKEEVTQNVLLPVESLRKEDHEIQLEKAKPTAGGHLVEEEIKKFIAESAGEVKEILKEGTKSEEETVDVKRQEETPQKTSEAAANDPKKGINSEGNKIQDIDNKEEEQQHPVEAIEGREEPILKLQKKVEPSEENLEPEEALNFERPAPETNKPSEHSRNSENLPDSNKEVKAANAAPEAFWLIFSGEYTKAMSKDWHSGHFSCWQCDEALTGQRYVLRDDHPYCIKCYESVFANVCEECNKIIGIDSKDLSYKDKHWHEACFLCNKCRVSLVDKQFGSKADKIYCGNCYDAQFASRCDGCGEIFRAGTKKMEYKTRQWHEKCFCCCVCKTPIGTKSFIPREQEIYCATCYEEKFATRCVKCNKIITSGGVTYKNEPWHRECFTCTNCNTSLAGQRFTSRDEKPYCADCFGELFAKRCTACSRPITGIGGTRFISFEDRHWHNDCFICASCKTSLVGRGFITDGDDIICPECAKQKLM